MHELSLAREMVETIERTAVENGASRVVAAVLRLGELTCVDTETLRFAFEIAVRGTVAEGCRLVVDRVPLTTRCRACGWQGASSPEDCECPTCGAVGTDIVTGREIGLESIEVEEEHLARESAEKLA